MNNFLFGICFVALPCLSFADSGHEHHHNHDMDMGSGTPTEPAGAHIHHSHSAGSWMMEYKYMNMNMSGLLDGSDRVATSLLTDPSGDYGYMAAPTDMSMSMHMIMGMYGISEKITTMVMLNYLDNTMDMQTRTNPMGTAYTSTMETSGAGDSQVGLMYQANKDTNISISLNIPTGSITEDTTMLMMNGTSMQMRAPYKMQLGSGTYDLIPSFTHKTRVSQIDWTTQASYTLRTGENDEGYTLGDKFKLISGAGFTLSPKWTSTFRGIFQWEGNIDGEDPNILQTRPMMMPGMNMPMPMLTSPTTDPDAQGGSILNVAVGVNWSFAKSSFLGMELGTDLYQNLDGPQMQSDFFLSMSLQSLF